MPLRNVAKWRTSQLRKLKRLVSEGEHAGLRDHFEAHRSSTSRAIAAHQEPARVALTMASLSWPDLDLPMLSMAGSSLLGQMPCSGIFRPSNVESSVSLHELLRTAGDFGSSVRTFPAPPPEQSKIIWEKIRAEVAAGLMTQPCTREEMDRVFGAGRWRIIVRFALCQASGKWRVIDNGNCSNQNEATAAAERIHTCSSIASAAMLKELRSLASAPLVGPPAVVQSTEDMTSAFRQVPVQDQRLRFSVVALWCPVSCQWLFSQLRGLRFGLKGAVLDFNRISAAVVAVSRRWLGIPILGFYDDFKITEFAASATSASQCFREFMSWFGFLLDPAKAQEPAASIVFLGNFEITAFQVDPEVFATVPKDERVQAVLQELESLLKRGRSPRGSIATLRGKIMHLCCCMRGRLGHSLSSHQTSHLAGTTDIFSEGLLREFAWCTALLKAQRWRSVRLTVSRQSVSILSDAAWA